MWILYCFLAGLIEMIFKIIKMLYQLIYKILNYLFSYNDKEKYNDLSQSIVSNNFSLTKEINNYKVKNINSFDREQQLMFKQLILDYGNEQKKLISLYVDKMYLWDDVKLNKILKLIEKENNK